MSLAQLSSAPEPNYERLLAMVLWKHHRTFGVTLTAEDIAAFDQSTQALSVAPEGSAIHFALT